MIGASIIAEIEEGKIINWVAPSIEPLFSMIGKYMYGWDIDPLLNELDNNHINIVDVGACIGSFGIVQALKHPTYNVLCIEPYPDSYACLVHNAKGAANVTTINTAIDNKTGKIKLGLPNLKDWEVDHKPIELYKNYGLITACGVHGNDAVEIDALPLDDLVQKVDVLKIDVEGMELRVLEGAKRILSEIRPVIHIELVERNQTRAGHSVEEVEEKIRSYNYVRLNGQEDKTDIVYFPKGGRGFPI